MHSTKCEMESALVVQHENPRTDETFGRFIFQSLDAVTLVRNLLDNLARFLCEARSGFPLLAAEWIARRSRHVEISTASCFIPRIGHGSAGMELDARRVLPARSCIQIFAEFRCRRIPHCGLSYIWTSNARALWSFSHACQHRLSSDETVFVSVRETKFRQRPGDIP
jgi:hypothetical protein